MPEVARAPDAKSQWCGDVGVFFKTKARSRHGVGIASLSVNKCDVVRIKIRSTDTGGEHKGGAKLKSEQAHEL